MKEKLKEYSCVLEFPVWGYNVYVVYTNNIQLSRENRSEFLGTFSDELTELVSGLHSCNEKYPDSCIFITAKSSVGVIAHEVFHALWRMFEFKGARMEDETFAYHLSYSLDKVLEFKNKIDKRKKPVRKK